MFMRQGEQQRLAAADSHCSRAQTAAGLQLMQMTGSDAQKRCSCRAQQHTLTGTSLAQHFAAQRMTWGVCDACKDALGLAAWFQAAPASRRCLQRILQNGDSSLVLPIAAQLRLDSGSRVLLFSRRRTAAQTGKQSLAAYTAEAVAGCGGPVTGVSVGILCYAMPSCSVLQCTPDRYAGFAFRVSSSCTGHPHLHACTVLPLCCAQE